MTLAKRIATRLREMDRGATRGPWQQSPDTYAGSVWVTRPAARGTGMVQTALRSFGEVLRFHRDDGAWPHFDKAPDYPQHERDAALVVALRNTLPVLIGFIEASERATIYCPINNERSISYRAALRRLAEALGVKEEA